MRVALAQLSSGPDPAANLALVAERVESAAASGAELVVFPEATLRAFGHPLEEVAEPLDGPFASAVAASAEAAGVTVVLGTFTPTEEPGRDPRRRKVANTLLVTGPGVHRGYTKIHLFDAFGFAESDTVAAGDELVVLPCGPATIGLATCYDLRFPEQCTALARAGADVVVVCASWGAGPGKAEQWDLLVRARALECTSWVLACGQSDPALAGVPAVTGAPTGIGRSTVVGPDGRVRAAAGGAPELLVVDLDLPEVPRVRAQLPVLADGRLAGVTVPPVPGTSGATG